MAGQYFGDTNVQADTISSPTGASSLSVSSRRVANVTDPSSAQDAATKTYVDNGASLYRPGGTDVAVADGGTGASTASAARGNLGLVIGIDIQAYAVALAALAGLTPAADKLPYFTGSGTAAVADFTSAGRALVDDADASAQRTTLGLGSIATQAASNVTITGGSITGITDLALVDGGTGASTAAGARSNLGAEAEVAAGTTAQYYRGDKTWQDFATDAKAGVALSSVLLPADYGFLSQNVPLGLVTTSNTLAVNGTLYVMKLRADVAITVTNLHVFVSSAGSGLTSGQNFGALYNSSKNLLAQTSDQTTAWGSAGMKTMALTSPQSVSVGYFYVVLWSNGTTRPTIRSSFSGGSASINGALSAANSLWATADTGITTTAPSSLGAFAAETNARWVGVS